MKADSKITLTWQEDERLKITKEIMKASQFWHWRNNIISFIIEFILFFFSNFRPLWWLQFGSTAKSWKFNLIHNKFNLKFTCLLCNIKTELKSVNENHFSEVMYSLFLQKIGALKLKKYWNQQRVGCYVRLSYMNELGIIIPEF